MKKFNQSMIGKKVQFINEKAHEDYPEWYPPVGTIGTIVPFIDDDGEEDWGVCWPEDSGVDKDGISDMCYVWCVGEESLELVEECATDGEIYKMLIPKLKKNFPCTDWEDYINGYEDDTDIAKAISLVYCAGFRRGSMAKPFLYQNIKENNEKDVPLC